MRRRERGVSTRPVSPRFFKPPILFQAILATPSYKGVSVTDEKDYRTLLAEAQKALANGTNEAIADRIALRDAVCDYFTAQRAKGATIGSILATVEDLLTEATARSGDRNGIPDGHHELARLIIDWCIQLDRTGRIRLVE